MSSSVLAATPAESKTSRDSIEGRVALVTGGGRGMGRAIAHALVDRGARVLVVALEEDDLKSLAHEFPVDYVVESIETPEGCDRIVRETRSRLGPIEVLVNNAGIGPVERPIWQQELAIWKQTMAVNVDGAFFLTRLASRDMVENRWGRILMTSSTAGELGASQLSAYCASKHAMLGLMRATAQDVAPFGVTCNAVLPGQVRTPMGETDVAREAAGRGVSTEEVWAEWANRYPAGRIVTAEEVAQTVAFLATDAASGINGEAIRVTLGGLW